MAKSTRKTIATAIAIADVASCYCAFVLALLLLASLRENYPPEEPIRGKFTGGPCDEIYVVNDGETLHTISDKCGDPFIVEQNPHIQDPDDVYPGLVIKITPTKDRKV